MSKKNVESITHDEDARQRERFYRKNVEFLSLVEKIKLWPTRAGVLHGIKSIEYNGPLARITTHCGESFVVRDSRNSRAARWLRNKWCRCACKDCRIPDWKLAKYNRTHMTQGWGSEL